MNQVALIGRLTKDPELRQFAGGAVQAGFVLAVEKKFKDKEADFVLCSIWGKQAHSTVEYCGKGSLVSVCGRLRSRSYMKGEARVFVTEVLCEELKFLQLKPPAKNEEKQAEEMLESQAGPSAAGQSDPAGGHQNGHPPNSTSERQAADGTAHEQAEPAASAHIAHGRKNGAAGIAVSPAEATRQNSGMVAHGTGLPKELTLPEEESAGFPIRH